MGILVGLLPGLVLGLMQAPLRAQVIEFESNGQKYQALTKSGVTIIYSHLPNHLHEYAVIHVAISNGSKSAYVVRPEDFNYARPASSSAAAAEIHAATAQMVVNMLMQKGNSSDVIRLVTAYEASVYGNTQYKATNGYEQRRQAALAFGGTKLKAAAAASVLALGTTKLESGDSSDGAVFFPNDGKPLTGGKLVVRTNTDVFAFNAE